MSTWTHLPVTLSHRSSCDGTPDRDWLSERRIMCPFNRSERSPVVRVEVYFSGLVRKSRDSEEDRDIRILRCTTDQKSRVIISPYTPCCHCLTLYPVPTNPESVERSPPVNGTTGQMVDHTESRNIRVFVLEYYRSYSVET